MLYISHIDRREEDVILVMKDYTLPHKLALHNNCTPSSLFSLHIYPDSKYFAYKHPTSNYKEKF